MKQLVYRGRSPFVIFIFIQLSNIILIERRFLIVKMRELVILLFRDSLT